MTAQEIYDAAQIAYKIKIEQLSLPYDIVNTSGVKVGKVVDEGTSFRCWLYLDVGDSDENPWEYLGSFSRLVDVQMCVYCYFDTFFDYHKVKEAYSD